MPYLSHVPTGVANLGYSWSAKCRARSLHVKHALLQDKLDAKGSKVKSLVCHPGGAATNLQATTAASGKGNGVNNRMFSFIASAVSQSAADGALPLLACAVASDAESGDFYVPEKEGFASKMIQVHPFSQCCAPLVFLTVQVTSRFEQRSIVCSPALSA